MRKILSSLVFLSLSAPAFAEDPGVISEPGALALVAMGVVAAILVRRKKK